MNGTVLANRSATDRSKTDFYETPNEVTTALLDFLEQNGHIDPSQTIWEPACGRYKMANVMLGRGYTVVATDLYPEGRMPQVDFLEEERPCDWIITNPPFSKASEFVQRALDLGKPCAFLLKSQFWHARSRMKLFYDNPPTYVLPLTWRPDFLYGSKSGSPTMECIWTVWCGERDTKYLPIGREGRVIETR